MYVTDVAQETRKMSEPQGLLVRMLDVALIVGGALTASRIRFENVAESHIDGLFVALATILAMALFPVFGIYQSWRGRSMFGLAGQV